MLLVIQMQDADINSTNTIAYGDGATGRGSTNLHSTGLYEYVAATGPAGASVNIAGNGAGGGLVNSYDFSATVTATSGFRTFQVIRVPQYSSATLGAALTAAAWNGAVHAGGILAIDVAGALNLASGTISVNQLGFKGALGVAQAGGPGDSGTDYVVASGRGHHGYKAEGIAGTPHWLYDKIANASVNSGADGYPSGDAARGAPGIAGGGGTDSNPAANDQNTGGGGGANGGQGGMGGNAWFSQATVGGLGGAAFPAAANKVVLGGGGGAGSRNNSALLQSSGGPGGGIVMIRAGSLAGTGTITANGDVGVTPANDGGGGGGAGGSVIVSVNTVTANTLTIHADGGRGTDAWPAGIQNPANEHGPGGGGAGGVIITSNVVPAAQTVAGGVHGLTTNGADPYGSSSGAAGVLLTTTPAAIPGSSSGGECIPALTTAKTTSTPAVTNTSSGTTATYSITVTNAAGVAAAIGVNISDALPAGFTYATTVSVALNAGATRPTSVDPTIGDTSPVFGTFTIPASGSVVITFTVNIASTVPPGTYSNPATTTYSDPTRTTANGTTTSSYTGGGLERVSVSMPDMTIAKTHVDPFVRGSTTSTYTLTARNSGGGPTSGTVTVTDTLPAGLTPTAAAGVGWTCPAPIGQTATCSRSDVLAAGAPYPPIIVRVTVLQSAASSVINQAAVSGGGQINTANDTASDPTNIISLFSLPNTGGLQVGADGAAPVGPNPGSMWLIALGLIAGAVAFALATVGRRGQAVRFRQRRRRPVFGASSVLLSLVVCGFAVSQSVPNPASASTATATTFAAAPLAADLDGRPLLVGSTVVDQAKPAPQLEETFHAAGGAITPARLRIPSIKVDAPVAGVGVLQDGSMGVPNNLWVSGWLSVGARPGMAGSAVIAGHRGIGTPALFSHLEDVRTGDRIHVSDATGGELVFEVTRVASLDLSVATQLQVFGPTAQHQLVLITCFGRYSNSTRTYDHRLVVFSRLLPNS